MIFVTLGTQDKTFPRLLMKIDELIVQGIIQDTVIAQTGSTVYQSKNFKTFQYVNDIEFKNYVNSCDFLITHGGVGSILTAIMNGTRVIAVPRLKEHKEHVNDHQLEIIRNFSREGYIIGCDNVDDLSQKLECVKTFKVKKYKSNNTVFCDLLWDCICDN